MLQTDIRRDLTINFYQNFQNLEQKKLLKNYSNLKEEASELLRSENVVEADMNFSLTADMRYIGQEYYVNVELIEPFNLEEINKNFHDTYEKQYGHSTPEGPCEFINLRLIALGKIPKSSSIKSVEKETDITNFKREVIFNQKAHQTDVLSRDKIKINKKFKGPAVIEESTATTVVPPNYNILKDDFGNIIISKDK